jgi:hypothetical protein
MKTTSLAYLTSFGARRPHPIVASLPLPLLRHHRPAPPFLKEPREKSATFRRVLEEPLSLRHEEAAGRLLYMRSLDGGIDDEAQPLLVGLLTGRASPSIFFFDSNDTRMASCSADFLSR